MKTINALRLFFVMIAIILMSSCSDKNYKMITRINKDASVFREVYAYGDSAFLAGDMTHNPYMFNIDNWSVELSPSVKKENSFASKKESDVKISPFSYYVENPSFRSSSSMEKDSSFSFSKEFNVKISREFQNLHEVSSGLQFDEKFRSFAAPEESVKKQFKWFYTTYFYTGKYKKLNLDRLPVSIDKYLKKEEQALWCQGLLSNYEGMNGMELKGELDDIETHFYTWLSHNIYEASFNTILHFIEMTANSSYSTLQLTSIKDTLFQINSKNIEDKSFQSYDICEMLDQYYKTDYFSKFYGTNGQAMDEFYNKNYEWVGNLLFATSIEYRLVIPGKIINSNTNLIKQDTLTWKIDGVRLIAADYELVAESRVTNIWAFIVTFVLVIIAVGVLIRAKSLRRN